MATKSTIFKANLQIADIDHSYYADHALTLARHPSETDERMMVRLVALALNADADWRPYKLEGYFFIAAIYFAFCFAMSRYSLWVEKQVSVSRTR